jgi:predicted RNA-binding protein
MKSDHIDNRKLYEVVEGKAVLEAEDVEHLKTCDECLEMIRVLVRQNLSKGTGP